MTREAFGPNLRRARIQRGISLEEIARATKVSETLWSALERNDCSRWPTGIFARSYVRHYAQLIGVDPDATVDEFCRFFPEGDRRAERVIREQAAIVGHDELEWVDPVPARAGDRRGPEAGTGNEPPAPSWTGAFARMFGRLVPSRHN